MKISILSRKYKRAFRNKFFMKSGPMFPWTRRRYLHIGFYYFTFFIQWGPYE